MLPEKPGPALGALPARQQLFVMYLVGLGGKGSAARAVKLAGYDLERERDRASYGAKLCSSDRVQAALLEQAKHRLGTGAAGAVGFVDDLMRDAKADKRVRLKAAEILMDRGGLHAKHEVEHRYEPTREEKLLRLVELARAAGRDPREVLGSLADSVDGDFQVLKIERDVTPEAVPA